MLNSKLLHLLGGFALIVVLFGLSNEVVARWTEAFQLYQEYGAKKQAMLNPAALNDKKQRLLAKKKMLSFMLVKETNTYDQSQAGLIDFLNACAKKTGIQYQSLQPVEEKSEHQTKKIGFTLDFNAGYHQIGRFVNALETDGMNVSVKSLEIISKEPSSTTLQVKLKGEVGIVSQRAQQ